MTYASEVLSDSPQFFTLLDRFVNPSTVPDISGNNRNGVAWQFGRVPYASWMDWGTAFSIVTWIKLTATGINMIAAREGGSGRTFQFRTNSGSLDFVKISGGSVTATQATTINDGNYNLVGATYDGSNIRLYKNSSTAINTTAAPGSLTGTQDLQIGWRFNTTLAANADQFNGEIIGLAVFNTVLAGSRFGAYYSAGVPTGLPTVAGWDGSSVVGMLA